MEISTNEFFTFKTDMQSVLQLDSFFPEAVTLVFINCAVQDLSNSKNKIEKQNLLLTSVKTFQYLPHPWCSSLTKMT